MNNQATITNTFESSKSLNFSIINWVNSIIEREQKNSLGICVLYVMVGSGIASLTAAFSVYESVSIPILIISSCLAMGTNASVLSQQTFKISSWLFIVSSIINIALLIFQIASF